MPLGQIKISSKISDEQKNTVLKQVSKTISEVTGKPETYIMVTIEDDSLIIMNTDSEKPAAFIQIKSIGGLNPDINKKLSSSICNLLNEILNIDTDRIYLNMENVNASDWGWDSNTFG